MRYPEKLCKGNTIGFVAPSFGCDSEPYKSAFENSLKNIEAMGYNTELGPNCYASNGIGISNTPELCAKELVDFYTSSTNQCLMSCGGGELMCETISHVDFELIKAAPPKWFTGYSDNTNFGFLLTTLCDVASMYGPGACNFGMEPWHKSVTDAYEILTGVRSSVSNYDKWEIEKLKSAEEPLLPYNCTEPTVLKAYDLYGNPTDSIELSGRMIGGCMDCLVNLLGTRFDKVSEFLEKYKDDGFIWFLESCDLNVFSIRRAMWQMKEAGWFKYCKGMLIGRPMHFDEGFMGLDQYEAVLYTTRQLGVPVIMDADIGHLPPMMPIINGSIGIITFADHKLSLDINFA